MLKRGTRRSLGSDRALALSEIDTSGEQARARLDVSVGPTYLQALLRVGDRLQVGGHTVELLGLEPPRAIRLRLGEGGPAEAPLRALESSDSPLRLTGLTLYALADGTRIGVGNVRREGRGPEAHLRVTLTIFPTTYAQDPTQGYDLHLDVTSGDALAGDVREGRVLSLDPAPAPGGTVELELR